MKSISVAFQGRCYEITAYRAVATEDYDGEGRVPIESKVQWLADGFTLVSEGGKYDDFEQESLHDTNLYPEEFMEANYADYCECVTSLGSGRMTIRIPEDEEFDPSKVCMVINEWYMPDTEYEMVYALLYDGRVCRMDADNVEPKENRRLVAGENPNNPGLSFEKKPDNNDSEPHNAEDKDENEEATEKRTFYQIRITYNNIRFSTAIIADSLEEAWASTDKDWDEEEEYIDSWEYKCIEVDEDVDEDEIGDLEAWDEVDWEEYKPYEL